MARQTIVNIPTPTVTDIDIADLPNPLLDPETAGLNIRDVFPEEGQSLQEAVRKAWGIENLLPIIENSPTEENFSAGNLIMVMIDPETGEVTTIDGNRRSCVYHVLHATYPQGHGVTRNLQGPKGGLAKENFIKSYDTITVLAYPPLTDAQFKYLQKRDVIARRGLGQPEFYRMLFELLDNNPRISEKEQELELGAELMSAAFPAHKEGTAWRETLQTPKRMWKMPRFVRDQFMRKINDTTGAQTKPTTGDARNLNKIWSQVQKEDKAGLLNNSIKTVAELKEAIDLATNGAQDKARDFLHLWEEIMALNGKKKKGGKTAGAKAAADIDAGADSIKQAGAPMASCLLRWSRSLGGCGTEKVFSVVRDFMVAAEASLKENSPEDYKALYKVLNEALG